jgi:hypothetical protein
LGVEIVEIMGQIEKKIKVWLWIRGPIEQSKYEPKKNDAKLQSWYLSLTWVKLYEIKSFVSIKGACATIERTMTKLKLYQIPNLKP